MILQLAFCIGNYGAIYQEVPVSIRCEKPVYLIVLIILKYHLKQEFKFTILFQLIRQ